MGKNVSIYENTGGYVILSNRRKFFHLIFSAFFLLSGSMSADVGCEEECDGEEAPRTGHVHFSSQDIDIYERTPDTLYQDADWPSKVEEYSDYLSH